MRGGREVRPGRLEGVYAFRPRAHQDRVGTVLAAFGVADQQSVNRACLRVNQRTHRHSFRMLPMLRLQFLLRATTKQFDDGLERPAASRMMSLDRAVHRIAIVGTGGIGPSLSRSLSLLPFVRSSA